jgi:prepilin signal peptidase PulO-like enzyme (type II secretory pathway)
MQLMIIHTTSINLWVLEVFTATWCFVMGSVIGSFLNVVIYRMPLGLNISKPKSRCPVCETPIRTRDNLPILGWILLRGKCRYCQSSISMRYPIVEAIVGCFFLLLYLALVHSGGQFLPYRIPNRSWGVYQMMEGRTWDLIALDLYYSYLFIVVLAAAYIQYDGQIIPRRLLIWCFLIGIGVGSILPELHPVPALIPAEFNSSQPDHFMLRTFLWRHCRHPV